MRIIKTLLLLVPVALTSGCYARGRAEIIGPAPPPPPRVTVDFSPLYYEGHVVYYDTVGYPYYIVEGGRYYIPRTHAHYRLYVRHYHRHPTAYRSWERSHAPGYYDRPPRYRQRTYRRPVRQHEYRRY